MGKASSRKTVRQNLGDHGEDIACRWYLQKGYKIIDRNAFVSRVGEIDVIASKQCGGMLKLVFAEVKTRSGTQFGYGFEAIDKHKRIRMFKSASAWMVKNVNSSKSKIAWQIDVVSIDVSVDPPDVNVFEKLELE